MINELNNFTIEHDFIQRYKIIIPLYFIAGSLTSLTAFLMVYLQMYIPAPVFALVALCCFLMWHITLRDKRELLATALYEFCFKEKYPVSHIKYGFWHKFRRYHLLSSIAINAYPKKKYIIVCIHNDNTFDAVSEPYHYTKNFKPKYIKR